MRRLRAWLNGRQLHDRTETPAETARREAEQRAREEDYRRTHPPQAPRLSGCCDPADQA